MTDYAEEQANELEALESIYPEELEILSRESPISFQITVKSQLCDTNFNCDGEADSAAECVLLFTYTSTYPDELPEIEVIEPEESDLDDHDVETLLKTLKQEGEENLGMAMVFTLVSVALEWVTTNKEDKRVRAKDEKDRIKQEAEEAERKRFEGHRVTVETFMAWKMKFDAEMAEIKRLEAKRKEQEKSGANTLTGKELFMMNSDLDDSDIQFLGGDEAVGGETTTAEVEVDETLFQDLDDLDFDDDDEDDEDFDPDAEDD